MVEMIGLAILAIVGWLLYLREKACLNYVSERSDVTFKYLQEAISHKDQSITLLHERHADLASKAQHVIDLHDKGLLSKLEKDNNAIEILRIHANTGV